MSTHASPAGRRRPAPGRRRASTLGLAGAVAYGVSTTLTGVLVAIGPGPGPAAGPSLADGTLGREVSAAPVVGPAAVPEGRAASAAVPPAKLARSLAATVSFQPLEFRLPSGATAPIKDSGLHPDGALVIPDDPATVGWWDGGALAGDAYGSVVIAGHVDSARYGLGVMAELKTLRTGQVVELRAGGRRMRYRVTSRRSVPQAELAARTDAFRQDIPPRLVLITCGGAFDPVRHRYQDNLIIYAAPVPS
ncbi:MAG TPA: class F sortase [Kineosporiaceae bacterium]